MNDLELAVPILQEKARVDRQLGIFDPPDLALHYAVYRAAWIEDGVAEDGQLHKYR
jgi:hypothetical protein